jgi:glycosyltransferase involved in cell wall biosynthesis
VTIKRTRQSRIRKRLSPKAKPFKQAKPPKRIRARWTSRRRLRRKPLTAPSIPSRRSRAMRRQRASKPAIPPVSLPDRLSAAAIVSVRNEENTIAEVIHELKQLPLEEIIVVINGSTDGSYHVVSRIDGVVIVQFPEPLGHDVGRAVGARVAKSDILLFVDGDIPISAGKLAPFLGAVHRGADLALNDITPLLGPFSRWDDVSRVKAFLNRSLGRADLGAASMTAVPHAISRRALETIGARTLVVPPKAQAVAMRSGLRVELCRGVDVVNRNKRRESNEGRDNLVARMIVGDHIEALREAMNSGGTRLGMVDSVRRRDTIGVSGI